MQGEPTAATPPVAVIYAAKSTQDAHGSIPDQIERCREYAKTHGWEVAEPPESDEATSPMETHTSGGVGMFPSFAPLPFPSPEETARS
jgi:hypothetical protein